MKIRHKSQTLLAYEALFRRLLPRHRANETIRLEYLKKRAGYLGEKRIDYKLSLFPRKDYLHLPDLRLKNNMHFFQMDSIILTPRVIFIIESKNMKGILEYYSQERQLIQIDGDRRECYQDPLLQALTQQKHLQIWLRSIGLDVPIEPIVVSTNQQAMIRNINNDPTFSHHFVTLENLLYKLDEMYEGYTNHVFNKEEINRLSGMLGHRNIPLKSYLMKQFNIKQHHLITGVPCNHCREFPIQKVKRTWHCPNCDQKGQANYQRVILDYFLLHNTAFITNGICRRILNIDSSSDALYLLKKMGLKTRGTNKGKKYFAPTLSQFPQDAEPERFETSIFD